MVLFQKLTTVPEAQKNKLTETLKVLESFLANSKWLASNDEISIADISILPTITTIKVSDLQHYPVKCK